MKSLIKSIIKKFIIPPLKRCELYISIPFLIVPLLTAAQEPAVQKTSLKLSGNHVEHTVNVDLPFGWSVAPQVFRNSCSLIDVKPGDNKRPSANTDIYVEPRLNHDDALKQLREFASVVREEDRVFTKVGGWPAVQITRHGVLPSPSQDDPQKNPKVLRIQTYIAVDDTLFVVASTLPENATSSLISKCLTVCESLEFESVGDTEKVEEELEMIQNPLDLAPGPGSSDPEDTPIGTPLVELGATEGTNTRIDAAGRGELEIAVSPDGLNVVVALQGRAWVSSNDGGATFPNSGTVGAGNGDPSVAYGQSGNFYIAWIDTNCGTNYQNFNVGTLPAQPFGYDCTGIARSTDNGVSFQTNTVNPAVVCIGRAPAGMADPANACFPDQEHIAADRVNAGGGGGDQVYSTWRNFNSANQDAGLVCTQDSGVNWTLPITLGANSFFPRITVGQDGFVYVAAYGGGFYRLWKFNSCANGLNLVAGFPVNVAARDPYDCPFAGHDRCDQNPSSQTVAVDDTDPNHVYYAFAQDTDANANTSNSNIFVRDSLDGGLTWPAARVVQANPAVAARRIMPWMSTTGGDAVLTWYEQSDPVPSDRTDHIGARVGVDGANNLTAREVFVISEVPDNWCNSGWPCQTRVAPSASESCPQQPQLAGVCGDGDNPNVTPDSGIPCDFSDDNGVTFTNCLTAATSPSGNNEMCLGGNGCPKYGDYNGNAATGGKLFAAWPSANSPPGVPPPNTATNTGVLFEVINLDELVIPVITIPGGVQFADTCNGETSFATLEVCNTGNANLQVDVITSDNPDFMVTVPSSGFPVTISPDFCFPFEVTFTPSGMGTASAILTVPSNDPSRPEVEVDAIGTAEEPEIVTIFDGEYGNVCLGDTFTQELRIQNSGGCELTVDSITSSNIEFSVASVMTFPLVIGLGDEVTVPIKFAPTGDTTIESSTISIVHDGTNTASPKQLTANGVSEDAVINTFIANNGDFGEVCADDFRDLELTVQNDGACPLEIDAASIVLGANSQPGDFKQPAGNAAGTVVVSGNSVSIPIRFSPAAFDSDPPAVRMADVEIDSHTQFASSILSTDITPITGIVPPPDINVAIANSGDFGEVCKGDHADLDLTLFNQGKCDLTISNIQLLPDAGSFQLPDNITFPLVLSPDADFILPIRFAPDECSDTPEMRVVKITSDDPDEMMVNIDISGVSPCPNLVIDPEDLTGLFAFPATVVDSTGSLGCFSDRTVTLRNNGGCPLTIDDISAVGVSGDSADYAVVSPMVFPIVLPSGEETLEVTVRFTPQADTDPLAPSEVSGLLTVVSDDPDFPHTAGLCGESAAQSGVRILVSNISSGSPVPVDEVDSITIQSNGKNRPSPINLRFTDQPVSSVDVCGNEILYHIDQETLPSTATTGTNPKSSYQVKAKEGNLQTSDTFDLGQCEFHEVQLELQDADATDCLLLAKGEPCVTDGECCSGNCKGPVGGKTCK